MANDEVVNVRMVLDPQGLQSQLDQVRSVISGGLSGAQFSVGQTMGSAAVGFNTVAGDLASFGSVLTSPTAPINISQLATSAIHGLIPQLTAPHSFDVKEWGDLHRNIVAGSAQRAAMGIGIGAADFAAGMVTQGAAFGLAAGAMGLGGAGTMGLYLADSMLLGGTIGGAASYVSDRLMEPLSVPHMAGQALRFAGPRMGLRGGDLNDAAEAVRSIQLSSGVTGNEVMEVLSSGLEVGAMGQVSGVGEFKSKFKQLLEGAKDITRSMHTELSESVQMLSSLQESGFGSISGAVNAVRMARVSSAMTGLTASESIAVAQSGAAMTVGNLGMSAQWGAASALSNYEGVTTGLRNKTIDQETMAQLGGRAGAAHAMEIANLEFLEGPLGRATLLGAFDSSGHLDPSKVSFEPGSAFRNAMTTVHGSGSPMRTLLEFAGRRGRLASETSPEEVQLGQAGLWLEMAQLASPRGPVTEDMIVGAAAMSGVNAEVARSVLGSVQVMGENLQAKRQQVILQARASAESNGVLRGKTNLESVRNAMPEGTGGGIAVTLAGAALGFAVGGPLGAAVGAASGAASAATLSARTRSNLMAGTEGWGAQLGETIGAGFNALVRNPYNLLMGGTNARSVHLDRSLVGDNVHNSVVRDLKLGRLEILRSGEPSVGVDEFNTFIKGFAGGTVGSGFKDQDAVRDTLAASAMDIGSFQGDADSDAFKGLVGRVIKRGKSLSASDEEYTKTLVKAAVTGGSQADFLKYGKLHYGQALMEGMDFTMRKAISDREMSSIEKWAGDSEGRSALDLSKAGDLSRAVGGGLAGSQEVRDVFKKRGGAFGDFARLFDRFGGENEISDLSGLGGISGDALKRLDTDGNKKVSKQELQAGIQDATAAVTRKNRGVPEVAGSGNASLPKTLQDLAQATLRLAALMDRMG